MSLDRMDAHIRSADAPAEVREAVVDAQDGALRIEKVVEGLRSYSRRVQEVRPLDLSEAVRSALKVASHRLRHVADLHTDVLPVPAIRADESRVVQALVNLLVNAAEATASGRGTITVRTFKSAHGEVGVEVVDAGRGVPPALLSRIAEPYFTTRASEGGLGLGLFITRGIVDAHGGRLEFDSRVGEGTCARMLFPALPIALSSLPVEAPSVGTAKLAPVPTKTFATAADEATSAEPLPRLLLVDDEPVITPLLSRRLGQQWHVTIAHSGEEALAQVRAQPTFESVLCDLMMPGMSGIALAEEVAHVDAALRDRMVFLTGGAVSDEAERFLGRSDVRWLLKPIDFRALDASLARFRLARRTGSPVRLRR